MKVKLLGHVQLFATPWTVAYQAPQSMEFSRQEYWSGLPFPSPGKKGSSPGIQPRDQTQVFHIAGRCLTIWATREALYKIVYENCPIYFAIFSRFGNKFWYSCFYCLCVWVLVTQSCPTLCDSMVWSLPGSSVHGILQARILEWVAIPFSRGIIPTQASHIAGGFFTVCTTREALLLFSSD